MGIFSRGYTPLPDFSCWSICVGWRREETKPLLYFDHAASTPPDPSVIQTITEVMLQQFGNPSSIHQYGDQAFKLLQRSREVCARALGVKPEEVLFTSGATESNNMAIKGAARRHASRGRHILTSATEHPSVYEACLQLQSEGFEVEVLGVDSQGHISPEQVLNAVRKDTILVSIMQVNNETGRVNPVEAIGALLKSHFPRVLFHVDGVQAFGKLPVQLGTSGIDLYSISAHKLRGPKGAGLLYVREGVQLTPLISGGGQERGLRGGTENIPLIVGMAKAVRLAGERQESFAKRCSDYRDRITQLLEGIQGIHINSGQEAPHIVHFSHEHMKAEVMLHMLEELGVLVSTRSACSSRATEPSRVLLAMGRSEQLASQGIRISFGEEHTESDIGELITALKQMSERVKGWEGWNKRR